MAGGRGNKNPLGRASPKTGRGGCRIPVLSPGTKARTQNPEPDTLPHSSRPSPLLLPEAVSILVRREESLDHLCAHEVAAELFELREPEVEAARVGVAPEIAEILHQDE